MSTNDVRIKDVAGLNVVPTRTFQTEAGAGDVLAGEPVKLKAAGSPYIIRLATAEPVIGTTTQVVGITKSASSHTATADGTVEVYMPKEGVIYECKVTTPSNFDTDAEVLALENDNITFDLTTSTFTIDENEGNAADHGLQIVGGDAARGVAYFTIRPASAEGAIA